MTQESSLSADPTFENTVLSGPHRGAHPKPWLAFLVAWIAPGLGHLYARAPRRGLIVALTVVLGIIPVGRYVVGLLSISRAGLLAGLFLVLAACLLVNPIDAWRTARARRDVPPAAWNRWWVYLLYLVAVWIVLAPVERFLADHARFRAFTVPSGAMMDTLLIGDQILVDMASIAHETVYRGEIVVFEYPPEREVLYVQRVVGLPGETIELRKSRLFIDGVEIAEPYVPATARQRGPNGDFGPIRIPCGQYFILGDNRDRSNDSREWGTAPHDHLRGRVRIIYLSLDRPLSPRGEFAWPRIRWERIGLRPGPERKDRPYEEPVDRGSVVAGRRWDTMIAPQPRSHHEDPDLWCRDTRQPVRPPFVLDGQ